jgi:predicted nucleotidyltransferase
MTKTEILKEIESIREQLIHKYGAERIILIGSAAWGDLCDDSDLDFIVIKRKTPLLGRERMREARRFINSKMPVDILVYRPDEFDERKQLGDPFILLAIRKGKVLYG